MSGARSLAKKMAECGILPDSVVRAGIRRLVSQRSESVRDFRNSDLDAFIDKMSKSPIAIHTKTANLQHYALPSAFFEYILGPNGKYSCCYWEAETESLEIAEESALELTCERAQIQNGHSILELGCGWGSLTLWLASKFPDSPILAVSNSAPQRDYIESKARSRGLKNISVQTADMNDFQTDGKFDRVVSVEMFEHMRNYAVLYSRISDWLKDDGLFFMHIFCHRNAAYEYIDRGVGDWMTRYFFTGGIMPSENLPLRFQADLHLLQQWRWEGNRYAATSDAWLSNMDKNKAHLMPLLKETYGDKSAGTWWNRWRIFFMAVSEMFASNHGKEWGVGHYLFKNSGYSGR